MERPKLSSPPRLGISSHCLERGFLAAQRPNSPRSEATMLENRAESGQDESCSAPTGRRRDRSRELNSTICRQSSERGTNSASSGFRSVPRLLGSTSIEIEFLASSVPRSVISGSQTQGPPTQNAYRQSSAGDFLTKKQKHVGNPINWMSIRSADH